MPARLETGVSYVGGRDGDDILRNAIAKVDGAEGQSVVAEGEEKAVGEVDGESKEMSVVLSRRSMWAERRPPCTRMMVSKRLTLTS